MHFFFLSAIDEKENRPIWKSVSLLAHCCPSDQLWTTAHRPILNILENRKLIGTPPCVVRRAHELIRARRFLCLNLNNLPHPSLSTAPLAISQPVTIPLSVRTAIRKAPRRARRLIIHLVCTESQYTRLNFSYQSVLFSYDYCLVKTVLLGDCAVGSSELLLR